MGSPGDWYAVLRDWQRARDALSAVVVAMQLPAPTPRSLELYSQAYAREHEKRLHMQGLCAQMRAASAQEYADDVVA